MSPPAAGQAGAVVLAGAIVGAADIGADAALAIEGDQGGLLHAARLSGTVEHGVHRGLGIGLGGQVQRVSTTRSSWGWPTRSRTCWSMKSTKYWAFWFGMLTDTRTGCWKAWSRWAGVIALVSTILSRTMVARRSARSVAETGL